MCIRERNGTGQESEASHVEDCSRGCTSSPRWEPSEVSGPLTDGEIKMRSIWNGAISFGLVTILVKLYSATEEKDVAFHQVHAADGRRVRIRRVCSIDGEEVPYSDIAKGYELPNGEVVILTEEDFAELPLTSSRITTCSSSRPHSGPIIRWQPKSSFQLKHLSLI